MIGSKALGIRTGPWKEFNPAIFLFSRLSSESFTRFITGGGIIFSTAMVSRFINALDGVLWNFV